ncbi:MAG: glycosyltransferase [Bacteroidetes bacterium]|nr:glycosyltransferase [Bacteroidota bacterium]
MKVLMFGWEFPPIISGGLGTASYGITRGLHNSGVELAFVMPTKRGQKIDVPFKIIAADEVHLIKRYESVISEMKNIDVSVFEKKFTIAPYFTKEEYTEYLQQFRIENKQKRLELEQEGLLHFTGNYGKELMSEVHRYGIIGEILGYGEDCDIIHAHDWLTFIAGVAAKHASGKPLVIHVHATEIDRSGEHVNKEVFEIEKYGMEHADKIIAVSHFTKNIIVSKYGIDADKIEVVHNAVEKKHRLERLGIEKNVKEKIVLFLGRVTMQKGPDYFVEAAYKVLQKYKNVRFVMAGSGDLLTRMILRVASLRMLDKFHFTGFLKGIEVEKMYATSDVYVMPSVSEPFGISPFEALLYDVPAIISKQSGVAEVLDNAIKVDFWDIDRLAEMMLMLLEDDELAKEVAEKSKGDMEFIHWDFAGEKIKIVYKTILNN